MTDEKKESESTEIRRVKKIVTLSRLKAGEQPFLAWGYSFLKVERVEEDKETGKEFIEETELRVPIKSIGLAEVMERIARKSPQPPITRQTIKQESEEGRALGLKSNRVVEVENQADPVYKEELAKYQQTSMYQMILAGLAMDIFEAGPDGKEVIYVKSNDTRSVTEVIDEDKAIIILRASGISNEHAEQLYSDIRSLTKREEQRVDQD